MAVRAADHFAAGFALHHGGIRPPGAEDQDLPARPEGGVHFLEQFPREGALHIAQPARLSGIDDFHAGILPAVIAFRQVGPDEFVRFHIIERLAGGRGAAQHDICLMQGGQHQGRVAAVVAGRGVILFIRAVVLFVDDG